MSAKPKSLGVLEYSDTWGGAYLLRRGLFLPNELPQIMDPEIAREGMRRLQPLSRLEANLHPDPDSDLGRVCVLESAHYMRNQLLRDADGRTAHGLEIRVPLVDIKLLGDLAPAIRSMAPGAGKVALAATPSSPLPNEVVSRAKSGFGVPTGAWINAVAGDVPLGRRSAWFRQKEWFRVAGRRPCSTDSTAEAIHRSSRVMKRSYAMLASFPMRMGGAGASRNTTGISWEHWPSPALLSSITVLPLQTIDHPDPPRGIQQRRAHPGRFWYSLAALRIAPSRARIDVVFCGHLFMAPLAALLIAWIEARSSSFRLMA